MIDSLFGLVMLLLMSAWMAELVSVQSKLSSSTAMLTPREQIDYLAAVSYANPDLRPCRDLLPTAKSPSLKKSLQLLLLSGQLMGRPDGQSIDSFFRASQAAGEVPYEDSESDQLQGSSAYSQIPIIKKVFAAITFIRSTHGTTGWPVN